MQIGTKDAESLLKIIMHLLGIEKKSKEEVTELAYNLINTRKFATFYSQFKDILSAFLTVSKKPTDKGHLLAISGPAGVLQISHDQENHKVKVTVYE